MEDKESNAKKGSDAVDELIQLLKAGDPALLLACYSIIKVLDPEMPKNWGPAVERISKVTGRLKSDIQVSFTGTEITLAIAVISAGTGGGNQVERKPVDDYRTDQGLPDDLIRILKLFTGATKPNEVAQTEFVKNADIAKGHAYFRDLSRENKAKLIRYLRTHRNTMVERALLGRGDAIIVDGKKVGVDHVNLFAFYDKQKPADKAWSYVAASDVIQSVFTTDVQPSSRGERQIQIGHGITLKRYGGSLFTGDTSI